MKKRIAERVLVLIVSIAVLLTSTGVYSVFAENGTTSLSDTETTSSSTTVSAAQNEQEQEPTIPAVTPEKSTENTEPEVQEPKREPATQPNVVLEGGSVEVDKIQGEGTSENPYKITDADDFIKMQDIINDTSSSDKHFIMTNDIDLSSVSYAQLQGNKVMPGTLVSVNKTLSDAAPNSVKFVLNGLNHKIYGLNVNNSGSTVAAIFGYVSAKSLIKYVNFEDCSIKTTYKNSVAEALIAVYNNGEIRNCKVNNVSLNVAENVDAGLVSCNIQKDCEVKNSTGLIAVNNGRVSDIVATGVKVNVACDKQKVGALVGINAGVISTVNVSATVKAENSTIGILTGSNYGRVLFSSADANAQMGSKAIFGAIAGESAGIIESCVATGVATGSNFSAGIVGKAFAGNAFTALVRTSYSFVKTPASSDLGGLVAAGKVNSENNFWSSEDSGRANAFAEDTCYDMLASTRLIVLKENETKTFNKSVLSSSWGNATQTLDSSKNLAVASGNVKLTESDKAFTLKAGTVNSASVITYSVKVSVNAGYKNATVLNRTQKVVVLTVSSESKGNGLSAETALTISNPAQLLMIKAAPFASFVLTNDIDMPEEWAPVVFTGNLNGAGYSINANKPLFSAVYGTVAELKYVLTNTVNTAVFGKANGAAFVNVQLLKGQNEDSEVFVGVKTANSCTGAFLNVVRGKTVIENCFANVPVCVVKEDIKSVAGFIGYMASSCAVIKNSGAATSITYMQKDASAPKAIDSIENAAGFIGFTQENKDGVIENCYATIYSALTPFAFIGGGNDKVKAENIYFGSSNSETVAAPESFKAVNATKWGFDAGDHGYIAGKGSVVSITLPKNIIDATQVKATDFSALFDAEKLNVNTAGITVKGNVIYLPVEAADPAVTVQNSTVVLVHNGTGLRASISLSNGLEKDVNGNFIIYYGVDFVFVNDNFEAYKDASFVLANDIDMSEIDFAPIGGSAGAFSGTLDGCGHKIVSLKVNATAKSALFGALDGAIVKNITFENAEINATGSYAAVLAGQIVGNSKISALTFNNSAVNCSENYAGILAGSIDNATVKNITIENCKTDAVNYTGAFAGEMKNSTVESVKVSNASVNGDKYVGAFAGLADSTVIKASQAEKSTVIGEKYVGGVAGSAEKAELNTINLNGLMVASKADSLEESAVVGGFAGELNGKVVNSTIINSTVTANGAVSVAGGVAAYAGGAVISGVTVGENVIVNGAVCGGFIGDAKADATVVNSTSYAKVNGSKASAKVTLGTGGVIGRVSAEDLGLVNIKNVNVSGEVSGYDSVGGIIGSAVSEKATTATIENCVVAATLKAVSNENALSGFVIGNAVNLGAEDIKAYVSKVVFSSYASSFGAYGTFDAPSTYCDLDKSVNASLNDVITTSEKITVSVSNNDAEKLGFVFDSNGWKSESESRVKVVESTENSVTLQASTNGIVAIVGTYNLAENNKIQLKVHFNAEADLAVKLNGEGTKESPYIVSTPAELEAVANYANENAYFIVTKDINFTSADFEFGGEFYNKGNGFTPIGTKDVPFNGTFMGNGHTISGVKINNAEFGGIFGAVSGAEISGLNITNITVNAKEMASAVAAKAVNSTIKNVNVTKAVLDAESAQGSVAVVAAYAEGCEISSVEITDCALTVNGESIIYSLACAGSVCARAIKTELSAVSVDGKTTIEANGTVGGFVGYCEDVAITASSTFATVNGVVSAAVAGNVNGALTVKNVIAGGKVSATDCAGGLAGKAQAAVKADDVVISAVINGEKAAGVVIGLADKAIFVDSDKTEVKFNKIVYSDYQNGAGLFADEEINAYQSADYLAAVTNVNCATSAEGDFVAVGEKALNVADALKFGVDMSGYTLCDVTSNPENLVSYNSGNNTVTATATNIDGAKLVLKYTNGLEIAVDMISVKGMTGEGTNEAPYLINSEDTMLLLSVFPNVVFEMTSDITLTDNWAPVKEFGGKLNGNGFTIKNLKVENAEGGLFEAIGGNAEVDGVAFDGAVINSNGSAGVVCASLTGNAKLRNISIINSGVTAKDFAGMVAGSVDSSDAEISLCTVTGGAVNGANAAGIAAAVSGDAKITDSAVVGASINGKQTAGGIVALANARSLKINGCDFSGDVNGENAGGIVGVAQAPVEVAACSADGNVFGTECEGGIIGLAAAGSSVTKSKALAKLSGKAKNTAEIVAKFITLPEDNEDFARMFSENTVKGEYDAFESAVMKYQNFVPGSEEEKPIILKGEGTNENPYIIEKAADLLQIPDGTAASFSLDADINFTAGDYGFTTDANGNTVYGAFEGGFTPIKNFAGEFNGNGHKITGLYINTTEDFAGLFAKVTGNGVVKNLHVEPLQEKDGFGFFGINGKNYVGAIAGYCDSTNGLENCSVNGGVVKGEKAVGGLVGGLAGSKILNSFALCEIKAQNNAGGFAGVVSGISNISNGFAACTVNAAGGSAVGLNNGRLEISDVLINGTSYGNGSVAVGENNGTLVAKRAIIAGANKAGKSGVMLADETENVYGDISKLGATDKNIKALTTKELTSSIPEGLDGWSQTVGNYPVPTMADDYSRAMALVGAVPAQDSAEEELIGNVQFNYTLENKTGESWVDTLLAGVLIKSKVNDSTITSDFFTTCDAEPLKVNKLLVTTGGFYINSSLPACYGFEITATDANGEQFTVSDAGSMGSYVEIGAAEYVNVQLSIVKTDIPWGLTSLWESLVR